jgi:dihydropyrimidinase
VIAPGSDVDVVLYDPTRQHTLGVDSHHMALDHSAWEGFRITGAVRTVWSRGRKTIADGAFVGSSSHGRFLKRGLSQYLL